MRRILMLGSLALGVLVVPAAASADDLTGAQSLLCAAVEATICTDDGDCVSESPGELNIPQFVEIDLKGKRMSTTKASGEDRSTPIRTLEREGGLLIVQGFEMGRAYSFVISESTGLLSVAVARDGKAVSVFGACTPISAGK